MPDLVSGGAVCCNVRLSWKAPDIYAVRAAAAGCGEGVMLIVRHPDMHIHDATIGYCADLEGDVGPAFDWAQFRA